MRKEEAWSGDRFPSSGRGFQGYGSCKSSGALDSQVIFVHVRAQSCPTLMGYSPPRSSVHGVLQVRILEWVAISSSRESSQPSVRPVSPALAGGFFITEPQGKTVIGSGASRVAQQQRISLQ